MVTLQRSTKDGGFFTAEENWETYIWRAIAFRTSGTIETVLESERWDEGWQGSGPEYKVLKDGKSMKHSQFNSLIARLGMDGWEPIPLTNGTHGDIHWSFKRQLPDA